MIPDKRGPIPAKTLQDYLRALAENSDLPPQRRQERLLEAYAELQFSLQGGARCSLCTAHVRHALPVAVERDGKTQHFDCLCLRCLQAEKGAGRELTLRVGHASFHYSGARPPAKAGAKPKSFREMTPLQSS